LLVQEQSRQAVLVAEDYAEGRASADQLSAAHDAAFKQSEATRCAWSAAYQEALESRGEMGLSERVRTDGAYWRKFAKMARAELNASADAATAWAASPSADPEGTVIEAADAAAGYDAAPGDDYRNNRAVGAESKSQTTLLRDVFGNPFRPVAVDPSWLTSNVLSLATAAYEHRQLPTGTLDSARLAILADALEDAGCAEPAILKHLRSPRAAHVCGCWLLDQLLDKE
jgi:hypothetical protein